MTKEEVIIALCELVTEVGDKVFDNQVYHDCFCCKNATMAYCDVDEAVVQYIKEVVAEKMAQPITQ